MDVGDEAYLRPVYSLKSVDHALRVIQLLRDDGNARVSDIALDIGVSSSTAHRLLAMLVYRGFAIQNEDRSYSPGPAIGAAPARVTWTRRLRHLLAPSIESLVNDLNETVSLLFLVATHSRVLLTVEGDRTLRVGDRVGIVQDARQTAGGKALLAELELEELQQRFRAPADRGESAHASELEFRSLVRTLDRVRELGYSTSREGTERGLWAHGMAIRDAAGRAIGSIAVMAPLARAHVLDQPSTINRMAEAVSRMESELRAVGFVATADGEQ